MIKTLRITTGAAALLSVVFFVFPVAFGFRSDVKSEDFLIAAGVIEKFNEAKVDRAKKSGEQILPLVKQAEAFGLYLNPPPKPVSKRPPRPNRPDAAPRPKKVSAKFTLVGTSYYELRPEESLALIDEPGKGFRWVRQSDELGHLVFEQIKDGVVVVRDGSRTYEIFAERVKKRSLIKGESSQETEPKPTSVFLPEPVVTSKPDIPVARSEPE